MMQEAQTPGVPTPGVSRFWDIFEPGSPAHLLADCLASLPVVDRATTMRRALLRVPTKVGVVFYTSMTTGKIMGRRLVCS